MSSDPELESISTQLAANVHGSSEQQISRVFQALSNPVRRAILKDLADGPKSVSQVVERFTLSQPTISRHLAILAEAGLVLRRRQGQHVLYRINERLMLEVGSIPMRVSRDRRLGRSVAPW